MVRGFVPADSIYKDKNRNIRKSHDRRKDRLTDRMKKRNRLGKTASSAWLPYLLQQRRLLLGIYQRNMEIYIDEYIFSYSNY